MDNESVSDQSLIEALRGGDEDAFNTLFGRHWQALYSTVFAVCKDGMVSSEITHDIFLNLWLKRGILKINCFKGYVTASARYHVFRYLKKMKRVPLEYCETLEHAKLVSLNDGDTSIRYSEVKSEVEEHVRELPKRCREIFNLSRMDHLSNDEIAERLDISKRTVENQLTHALHHLRISLKNISIILLISFYL